MLFVTGLRLAGGDASVLGMKPTRVILAMHRSSGPGVTAEELFTFTKVNLVAGHSARST
jgi:hypothetical protein